MKVLSISDIALQQRAYHTYWLCCLRNYILWKDFIRIYYPIFTNFKKRLCIILSTLILNLSFRAQRTFCWCCYSVTSLVRMRSYWKHGVVTFSLNVFNGRGLMMAYSKPKLVVYWFNEPLTCGCLWLFIWNMIECHISTSCQFAVTPKDREFSAHCTLHTGCHLMCLVTLSDMTCFSAFSVRSGRVSNATWLESVRSV